MAKPEMFEQGEDIFVRLITDCSTESKEWKETFKQLRRYHEDQIVFEHSPDPEINENWFYILGNEYESEVLQKTCESETVRTNHPQLVENAVAQCSDGTFEKRLSKLDYQINREQEDTESKDKRKQENQRLQEEVSELKSRMKEMMQQMQEDEAEGKEGKSDTNDRLEDLYEEAGLNEPEL